jgi:hypothetical protein
VTVLATHAAWVLAVTFAISLLYEVWRATSRAGTSRHDSLKGLVQQLVLYVAAAVVVAGLFLGANWAPWAGLVFCVVMILVSVLYYNPVIMLERRPGLVDWVEDLVFTGLLFVAATLLLYDVLGWELSR